MCTYLLNLVLVECWYPVDDHPRYGTAKVDDLVHEERHDSGGEDVVTNVGVPCRPHEFEIVELDIVF